MTKTTITTTVKTVPSVSIYEAQEKAQKEATRVIENAYLGSEKSHYAYRNFTRPSADRKYVKVMKEIRRHPGQTRKAIRDNYQYFDSTNDDMLWSQLLNAGLIQYTKTTGLPYQYTITPAGEAMLKSVGC